MDKFITVGNERFYVLGMESVASEFSTEELKRIYGADSILKNGNMWFLCHKIIEAEFEDIDEITKETTENSGSN